MSTETATPGAEVQAETIAPPQDASLEAKTPESEDPESKSGEGEQGEPKKEKTPEERERLRGNPDALLPYCRPGATIADIAAALGIPAGTVTSRLHAARRVLRVAVEADARLTVGEGGPA